MALTKLPGALHWPIRAAGQPYATPTIGAFTVTGSTVSRVSGRIKWEDDATHTVASVRFLVGTVTTNLTVNGASVGVAIQSKGTSAWLDGGTNYGSGTKATDLSASASDVVTVTGGVALPNNEYIQVKFDAVGTQDWQLRGLGFDVAPQCPGFFTGTSASQSVVPLLLFTAGDGAVGVLDQVGYFETDADVGAFKSYTTAIDDGTVNEFGTRIKVPFDMEITAVHVTGTVNSNVIGYELAISTLNGSNVPTLVHSQQLTRVDWGSSTTASNRPGEIRLSTPVTLTGGTTYAITLRNRSNNNGTSHTMLLAQHSIGNAGYADALPGGVDYCKVSRAGGRYDTAFDTVQAYTVDTTAWIPILIKAERIDNGVGGGGGGGTSPETYGGAFAG